MNIIIGPWINATNTKIKIKTILTHKGLTTQIQDQPIIPQILRTMKTNKLLCIHHNRLSSLSLL